MIKELLVSFCVASALCLSGYLVLPHSEANASAESTEEGESEEEGFGVNMGSRKYWEYIRLANEEGIIPAHIEDRVLAFSKRLPRKGEERSLAWQARGPYNKGGRSRAFAIDVQDENHLLAGSVTGGLWNSNDGGQSWLKATAPDQLHSVSCVVQDKRPGHEDTWYFGTGEEFYGVVSGTSFTSLFSGDGIFKSTDNGATWQPLASTSSNTPQNILQNGSYDFVWNMAIDHNNTAEDVVYAAVYNGIIRSTDGGATWTNVLGFTSSASEFTDVMITPSGILYATFGDNATNGGGFYRSTNGIDWVKISPVIGNLRRTVMAYNPQNENEVYFLGETIQNSIYPLDHFLYKYTYVSGDGTGTGGLWENRMANLPDVPCSLFIGVDFDFGTFRSQNSYDLCIAHHPTQNTLFIGGININRSTSAFANDDNDWIGGYRCNVDNPVNYTYPNHHSDEHAMIFSPSNPSVMYSINDGGLYRTDNCLADSVSWTPLNHGYVTTQFYTVAMEQGHASSDYVMGGMQDNGSWLTSSPDQNALWKEIHADDGSFCAIPEGREYIITSSQSGKIQKKLVDDNGNLLGTERIDPANGPSYLFINPLLLDPWNQNDLFMAGNKTIWYYHNVNEIEVTNNYIVKRDSGWVSISASNIPITAGAITCLDKSLIDNSVIYYGTSQGKAYRLDDCYGNPTRTAITDPNWAPSGYVSCVTTNDFDPQEVMLSFSNYGRKSIFHSSNGGTNWEDVSGNLEEFADGTGNGPAVYWVEIYPSTPVTYFAATSAGLYSTTLLNGESTVWEMEGANTIGNVIIDMVKARPYDGKIIVGTHGNGVYSANLEPVAAAGIITAAGAGTGGPAFPNPFNDELTIPFFFESNGNATVSVFDLTGRKVQEFQWASPGRSWQRIVWNPANDVPSGTYVYVVQQNGKSKTGKVMLQR